MEPVELWRNVSGLAVAHPDGAGILFLGGFSLGLVVAFAFARREIKLHRTIIEQIKSDQSLSSAHKDELLKHAYQAAES